MRTLSMHEGIDIDEKVRFLSQPGVYPERANDVEVIETHMAWVFLTDEHAWKMKKPVQYEYLDFSTLELRYRDCHEEIRLNRRLAGELYLGLVPLTCSGTGELALAGGGDPVEWLVKMKRLPAGRMLDRAIADRTVGAEDVEKVGRLLAGFYQGLAPVEHSPQAYRKQLARSAGENHRELMAERFELPAEMVEPVTQRQFELLEERAALFDARVDAGMIRETHGDLRPEHICLCDRPVIIDALEFNRDFRILDPVSELMHLKLECDRLGAPWVGDRVFQTYVELTQDGADESLLRFHRCHHACTRAKIAVWHLLDEEVQEPEKWITKARHYLHLASDGDEQGA